MTSLISINPRCRRGDYDIAPIRTALRELGPVVECDPDSVAEFEKSLRTSSEPIARLVIGGGDGTISRLLPLAVDTRIPLGIIPLGTANDFARSLGLSLNPDEAALPILAGHTRRIDVGDVNGHLFVNAVSVGLGPALTHKLDRGRKRTLGVLAYFTSLLEVFSTARRHRATVTIDDVRHDVRFMQITIANGIHYGGGMTISDDAELDDGLLRVLCLEPQSPTELLGKLMSLRRGANANQHQDKMQLFTGRKVQVELSRSTSVTADGELITETPLTCSVQPSRLDIFCTAGA